MCGIFGYVGDDTQASRVVMEGLRRLEYRGYDSWGVAVRSDGVAAVVRSAGKLGQVRTHLPSTDVDLRDRRWPTDGLLAIQDAHGVGTAVGGRRASTVEEATGNIGPELTRLPSSNVGIGHTRWATHGAVTSENAHPHCDCTGRLAIVHNGIIENYQQLRDDLATSGHVLKSETDTEVAVHLMEDELGSEPHGPDELLRALLRMFHRLEGLNAIAVLDGSCDCLVAAKSGSPLVVGHGENGNYLASDPNALLPHTRRLTFLENGQAVLMDSKGVRVFDVDSGSEIMADVVEVAWKSRESELDRHPDFMTKEIHDQPAILERVAEECAEQAQQLADSIRQARGTYLVGCGTAGNAALVGQYLFSRIAARHVNFACGSEFSYLEHFIKKGSLAVALSQSGETIDIIDAVSAAKARGCSIAALVNVEGSTLYRMADLPILLGAGPECCVLATKSFTAKVAILLMVAHALKGRLEEGQRLVRAAAAEIDSMLRNGRKEIIADAAERIKDHNHLYVIGRGLSYPLALEAALKVKEVSYIHAEGFAGGELKHGVIALIEPGTPCLVLAPHDETHTAIISGAMEVRARGGFIIGISPENNQAFDLHIPVAEVGDAAALTNIVPAQLLAYKLARLRGCDPDKPRNLAKSVTVR